MSVSIVGANGTSTAMTPTQKTQLITDLGVTPAAIGAIATTAAGTAGSAVLAAPDAATARTALGLGTAATAASTAFATSAQGAKADTAVQPLAAVAFTTRTLTAADNNAPLTVAAAQTATIPMGLGAFVTHVSNTSTSAVNVTVTGTGGVLINGTANGSAVRSIPANATLTIRSVGADSYNVPDVSGAAVSATQPLRFVGHRNKYPAKKNTAAGTLLNGIARFPVYIGSANARTICLSFFNTMLDANGNSDITNAVSIDAVCLERASPASFQAVTFSGSRSISLAAAARDIQSDEISATAFGLPYFTRGDLYYVRIRWSVAAAGMQWASSRNSQENGVQCAWRYDPAATTLTNFDGTGAFTVTGTALTGESEAKGLCPLVLGRFVSAGAKVFLSYGDSILEGTNYPDAPTYVQYALENASSGKYAHGEVTAGGSDQLDFSGTNYRQFELLKYANVLVDELGTNGPTMNAGSISAFAQIYNNARSAGIQKIVRAYLLPRTSCALTTTSLTSVGTTCTLTPATGTLPAVGQKISVIGATPSAYNVQGVVVTRAGGGSYDYTAASAPGSAATGTIYWSDLWQSETNQSYQNGGAGGIQDGFHQWMEARKSEGLIDVTLPLNAARGTDFYKWKAVTPQYPNDTFSNQFASGTHPTNACAAAIGAEISPTLDALTVS